MKINILEVKMDLRVVPRNRFDFSVSMSYAAFYKVPHVESITLCLFIGKSESHIFVENREEPEIFQLLFN